MNPAVIEDLYRDGRTCWMGDQLSCTYQLMARQKVDKKKVYRAHSKSAKHHFKDSKNTKNK